MGKKNRCKQKNVIPNTLRTTNPKPSDDTTASPVIPKTNFLPHGVTNIDISNLHITLKQITSSIRPSTKNPLALTCYRTHYLVSGNPNYWWIYNDVLEFIASKLIEDDYVVIDGFLDGAVVRDCDTGSTRTDRFKEEVWRAYRDGKLPEVGGLVDGRDGKNTPYSTTEVRGDYIGWFDGKTEEGWSEDIFPDYVLKVSTLVNELKEYVKSDKNLNNVTSRSRCMVTCYPPGGKYTKHVDNGGATSNGRRLTALFYLNNEWKDGDGGELVVYEKGGKTVKDTIQPVADRLVLFWSDERVPHEVSEASKNRFTVTIWFFDTIEWEEAKRLGVIPKPTVVGEEDVKKKEGGKMEGGNESVAASAESAAGAVSAASAASAASAEDVTVRQQPKLAFVDEHDDNAREPESQGVSNMVCTNEPFIPANQEPTLFEPALTEPSAAEEVEVVKKRATMEHALVNNDTDMVLTVTVNNGDDAVLTSTTLDVTDTLIIVSNDSCDPSEIRCDCGEEIVAENVKAKFSKKKGTLKVTVQKKAAASAA
jgi:hypoxia-inducible factor (prolyl hydroxylase)